MPSPVAVEVVVVLPTTWRDLSRFHSIAQTHQKSKTLAEFVDPHARRATKTRASHGCPQNLVSESSLTVTSI